MAKRTINTKLYQSHQKAIQALRKYKREANFMNKKMNELVDEIVEALEADSHVERKTSKEYKCDLVVEDFMNMFLKEMEVISRIPFDLIFYVYRVYCNNHDFFSYDEKKYFKYSMLEYIESRPEWNRVFEEGQMRITAKDKEEMPSVVMGVDVRRMRREFDRERGLLVKVV